VSYMVLPNGSMFYSHALRLQDNLSTRAAEGADTQTCGFPNTQLEFVLTVSPARRLESCSMIVHAHYQRKATRDSLVPPRIGAYVGSSSPSGKEREGTRQ
jgi:hypothetical protein